MTATTAHKRSWHHSKIKKTQESLFKSKGKSAEGVRSTQNAVNLSGKRMEERVMFTQINNFITWFDGVVWGLPLIILILFTGILLTTRLGLLQVRHLGKALKFMVKNEEGGDGEVTSFGALCTALSATIGTGNIVGVATAIAAGGPGALFWMIVAAFFGMATKYAEGLLAIKYRTIDKEGHVLGGPSTTSKTVWENSGDGLPRSSHFRSRCGTFRYRNLYTGKRYLICSYQFL